MRSPFQPSALRGVVAAWHPRDDGTRRPDLLAAFTLGALGGILTHAVGLARPPPSACMAYELTTDITQRWRRRR